MKKLFLSLVIFCTLQVSAQTFHFAPKAGVNIANVTNSGADSRIGLNVGFTGEMELSPVFSVESGVYYSMQGCKLDDVKFNLDYINVPVLAKVYAYQGLNFFAGPQLGFNTSSSVKMDGVSVDMPDGFMKKVDLGVCLGAGYQFDMGLQLSASYTYGLIGIFDENKISSLLGGIDLDGENAHNSVIQISLGWRF